MLGALYAVRPGCSWRPTPVTSARRSSTGAETRGHIGNYHRAMERAAASIELVPAPLRDISRSASRRRIAAHQGADSAISAELVMLATQEQEGEQVVQLNMQLFR